MRIRALCICAIATLAALLLAGCGASSTTNAFRATTSTAVPTVAPTVAPTATDTPTAAPITQTLACPATISGQSKVFADQQTGLTFSYPAAWTESQCTWQVKTDGTVNLGIGNLFAVSVVPRQGLSIQQWVSQHSDQNETVTLATLHVLHAMDAATVSVTVAQGVEYDREPFASAIGIVAGTTSFYVVYHYIVQMNTGDTIPPLSISQLAQQIVTTFDVA